MVPVARPRNSSGFGSGGSAGRLAVAVLALWMPTAAHAADDLSALRAQLDVIATDARGRPVADLRPGDLSVLLDGVPQTIDALRLVTADGPSRLVGIFLDDFQVSAAEAGPVRATLRAFVERELGPRDQVLVLRPFDSLMALKLSDRDAALAALDGFAGRRDDFTPRTPIERDLVAGTPERVAALRTQVARSALNALALHLGSAGGGRKALIAVGRGWAGAPRVRGEAALPMLDTIVRSANRSGVAIYPLDPAAFGGISEAGDREGLATLAGDTGGQALLEATSLEAGLKRIARDAAAYYLVTFGPGPRQPGAGTAEVRPVEVRTTRAGLRVDSRRSFGWGAEERAVALAALAISTSRPPRPPEPPRRMSPLIRPWFGFERGTDGATRVRFVWEPVAPVPGDRTRRTSPQRLTLRAYSNDGVPVYEGVIEAGGASRQTPEAAEPPAPGAARGGRTGSQAVFEASPGRMRVEMVIEDAGARVVDTDVRDLLVRPMRSPVTLGSPEVFRVTTARDYRELAAARDPVPVAAREFSRRERILVRLPVYGGERQAAPSVALLGRTGQRMRTLTAQRLDSGDGGQAGAWYQVDLTLADLAPGEYTMDIVASQGEARTHESLAFRVTS